MKLKYILIIITIAFAIPVFAQQPDLSLIPYRKGDLWGYATADKKMVIAPEYQEANFFYAGFASVKKGEKYGYINKEGKVVIPFNYYIAKNFRYGYFENKAKHKTDTVLYTAASLKPDGYEICINTKGVKMPQCPAINENTVVDKNAEENLSEKTYARVAANGNIYDKIIDDYTRKGDDDIYYLAVKNNNYGVFNNKFEVVITFKYSFVKKVVNSTGVYVIAEKDGIRGMFNGYGSLFIPFENTGLEFIKTNADKEFYIVIKKGNAVIKDMKLNDVLAGNYTDIVYDADGGFILTGDNNLKGYYFSGNGKTISPKFKDIKPQPGTAYLLVTSKTGKTGFMNRKGDEFFED